MEAENQTLFFRMLAAEDKGAALAEAITAVRDGRPSPLVYSVNPASFCQVPGSPFAYWVSERIRRLFKETPPFEGEGRTAKQGMATGDDFRFLRAWWEVPSGQIATGGNGTQPPDFVRQTYNGKYWLAFAKGGGYSPYFADITLLVNWCEDGQEIKHWVVANSSDPRTTHWSRRIPSTEYYFRPGLTYPDRTSSPFSPRVMPAGTIISVKGSASYANQCDNLWVMLGVMNTRIFRNLMDLILGTSSIARSYQAGTIGRVPWPRFEPTSLCMLVSLAHECYSIKCSIDCLSETGHFFRLPTLGGIARQRIADRAQALQADITKSGQLLSARAGQLDAITSQAYGLADEIWGAEGDSPSCNARDAGDTGAEEAEQQVEMNSQESATQILSALPGCALGRWDIRLATGEKPAPDLPEPFAPLPVCSPGMLTGDDGLPAREAPPGYPLRISWDGILVDDPGENGSHPHQEDIVRRVREVLEVIWRERAEAIEQEACEILGVKSLREYFRKPAGFFADHLKRYSKSRRQAPIYWPLSTASGSYTLWIYYHRLTDQTLFAAADRYVGRKIEATERWLRQIEADLTGASGRKAAELRQAFEEAKTLLDELTAFRDELLRVANLPYKPDLNDGVLITAAPLWKLFRLPKWRKDLDECWRNLEAGDYDWAHLAYSMWPERVREKCKTDRSFAIAHGLEELCSTQRPKATKARRKKKAESTQMEM